MSISINKENARKLGFTEKESAWIEAYANKQLKNGKLSDRAEIICLNPLEPLDPTNIVFVCLTAAEAIDHLRPGAWRKLESELFRYHVSRKEQHHSPEEEL